MYADPKPTNARAVLAPTSKQVEQVNSLPDVTPQPKLYDNEKKIDGARALDFAEALLTSYARWPSPQAATVTALWVAHTHFTDMDGKLQFRATPRWLAVADKGSGKSQVMTIMQRLSKDSTGLQSLPITSNLINNQINDGQTVFLDETHRMFGNGSRGQAIQSIVTNGYTPEGSGGNAYGGRNVKSMFGPLAMAGRPALLQGDGEILADVFERSYLIEMEKSFDPDIPQMDDQFEYLADKFQQVLALWGAEQRLIPTEDNKRPTHWPQFEINPKLSGRQKQIAQPLLAVADMTAANRFDADGNPYFDMRWSVKARKAVDAMLLGKGGEDGNSIMDEAEAMMENMGLALPLAG